jgi:hypothetical protein
MKKIILSTFLLIIIGLSSYGQFTKIGAGFFYDHKYYFNDEVYGDHKLGNPAFFFTGIYELNLQIHIAPRIAMFFPNKTTTGDQGFTDETVITGYSFDADGHYVFNALDKFEFYGIGGINILYVHRKNEFTSVDFNETIKDGTTSMGLNLGVGSYWKVKEQFDIYGEVKCIVASQVQVVGTIGVLLNIDWLAKNEDPAF